MADNNMTPEQDLITRDFYTKVLSDESLFTGDPVGRRQSLGLCRRLLGYMIVGGVHVSPEVASGVVVKLGETPDVQDEWADDTRRAQDEANQSEGTNEADSSVEAESAEVREAVLSEDV